MLAPEPARGVGRTGAAAALLLAVALGGCDGWGTASEESPAIDPRAPSGGEPDAYTAAVVTTVEREGERGVTETRVARRGDWRRQEWVEAGRRLAIVERPDLGGTFLIDLDRNIYIEQAQPPTAPADAGDRPSGEQIDAWLAANGSETTFAREAAGASTVDGHPCVLFRTRIETLSGGASESLVWEATDLGGLAIRSELQGPSGGRVVTELRDVQTVVDPLLFDVPAGARRVDALDAP